MNITILRYRLLVCILFIIMVGIPLYANDDKINPKEPVPVSKQIKACKDFYRISS